MTIRDIHLDNLKMLIQRFGSLDKLLDAVVKAGEDPVSKKYIQQVQSGWQGEQHNRPRDLGPNVCRRLEKAAGEPVGWMDVAHAQEAESLRQSGLPTCPIIRPEMNHLKPWDLGVGGAATIPKSNVGASRPVGQWFPREEPVPKGYLTVEAVDLEVGAGSRLVIVERPEISLRLYADEFFQSRCVNPANCRAYRVGGQSMEPFLFAGDWVVVDTSLREPPRQSVTDPRLCTFVFRYYDEIMVKKLHRLPGGGFLISSVNSGDNPPIEVRPVDAENLELYGAYMDRSGGRPSKNGHR